MSDIIPQELIDTHMKTMRINFIHECRQEKLSDFILKLTIKSALLREDSLTARLALRHRQNLFDKI